MNNLYKTLAASFLLTAASMSFSESKTSYELTNIEKTSEAVYKWVAGVGRFGRGRAVWGSVNITQTTFTEYNKSENSLSNEFSYVTRTSANDYGDGKITHDVSGIAIIGSRDIGYIKSLVSVLSTGTAEVINVYSSEIENDVIFSIYDNATKKTFKFTNDSEAENSVSLSYENDRALREIMHTNNNNVTNRLRK
jgi:hypothetical protein